MKNCRWTSRYHLIVISKVEESWIHLDWWLTKASTHAFRSTWKSDTRWICNNLFQHVDTSWTLYLEISIGLKEWSLKYFKKIYFSISCCDSVYHRHPYIRQSFFQLTAFVASEESCKKSVLKYNYSRYGKSGSLHLFGSNLISLIVLLFMWY